MAIVTEQSDNILELTFDGLNADDWELADAYRQISNGRNILGVVFKPGAISDKLVLRDASITGPEIIPMDPVLTIDTLRLPLYGVLSNPHLVAAQNVLSAGAKVIFYFR